MPSSGIVQAIDQELLELCGFHADVPALVPLQVALDLLGKIEPTMYFSEDDAPPFDWDGAKAALAHLSQQHQDPTLRGGVLLWAAKDRSSARLASESSHATYIETPDSQKTEGRLANEYAIDTPILFLLRQDGGKDRGWNGAPFYWPVIRAQRRAPTTIYTAETIM